MRFIGRKFLPGSLLMLISCGMLPNQAMEVVNDFYEYQQDGSVDFPEEMFASLEAVSQARFALSQRGMIYGGYVSRSRVRTNWRILFGENGKKEVVTYTCTVTGVNGKTRETLMLERHGDSKTFLITAYMIEDISIFSEPSPTSTV